MKGKWWFLIYLFAGKSNFLLDLWLKDVLEELNCVRIYRSSLSILSGFWNFKYLARKKNPDGKFLRVDSKNCHRVGTAFASTLCPHNYYFLSFNPSELKFTFPHYTFSQCLKAYLCKYQGLLGLPATKNLTPKCIMINSH